MVSLDQEMVEADETLVFSPDERAKLILAVSQQTGDLIDWLSISANVFENKFSPCQCIFEFLKLPISQSLALSVESTDNPDLSLSTARKSYDKSSAFAGEFPVKGKITVFNDAGNPLLSQVAIFARLLEQLQTDKRNSCTGNQSTEKAEGNDGEQVEFVKRTTRGAQKRKDQESNQVLKELNENVQAQANHYLVPPSSSKMLDAVISSTQLR